MKVGEYKLEISVQLNGVGSFYALSTSPFFIRCHVTTTDPRWTTITGPGQNMAVAGIPNTFLVTVFDEGKNQQQIGGDAITVSIKSKDGLVIINEIEVFDNNDGTYKVKYEVDNSLGVGELYDVKVTTNGNLANTKSEVLDVSPNESNPLTSLLTETSTPLTIEHPHTFNF